jgi:hypothetical protein
MKKITIGFSTPKKFNIVSFLVRSIERTPYSHTFIGFHGCTGRKLVTEVNTNNVNINGWYNFIKKNKVISYAIIKVNDELYWTLIDAIHERLGHKYGYKTIIGLFLNRVFGLKNPWTDGPETLLCHEYLIFILNELGFSININAEKEGPKALHDWLKNHNIEIIQVEI